MNKQNIVIFIYKTLDMFNLSSLIFQNFSMTETSSRTLVLQSSVTFNASVKRHSTFGRLIQNTALHSHTQTHTHLLELSTLKCWHAHKPELCPGSLSEHVLHCKHTIPTIHKQTNSDWQVCVVEELLIFHFKIDFRAETTDWLREKEMTDWFFNLFLSITLKFP